MIRRFSVILAAALLGAAQTAMANDALSNTYWDVSYVNEKVDAGGNTDYTPEGFRLGASLGMWKFLNFTMDYDQRNVGGLREGFGSAGFAYHTTQARDWQLYGQATYERFVVDNHGNPSGDFTEEGYGVEVGGRYALDDFVFNAGYRYIDYGSVDGTNSAFDLNGGRYGLGVEAQLCPWWSLVAGYGVRELKVKGGGSSGSIDYNAFTVGFRHYFASDTDRLMRKGGLLNGWLSGEEAAAPAQ